MTEWRGKFVWHELMTSNPAAAAIFYGKVFGWTSKDSGMPGMSYTLLSAGERMVGGAMAIPEAALAMGAKPIWLGYVAVEDVDASAARIVAAGGRVYKPAEDIPGIGRFSVLADPQGATIIVFRPIMKEGAPAPDPVPMGTPGHIGWNELHTSDGEKAFAFYSAQFGWTKDRGIDMGPMGVYQIFAIQGEPSGGMMRDEGQPRWLYYVNVTGIDAAMGRVTAAGGKIVSGPQEVPGGSWISECTDPQGVRFAMVGPKG